MTVPFQRPRKSSVRPSPVFLAVLAITALGGYLAWTATQDGRSARIGVFLFVVAGWVVTLCFHEFAHAFLAWRFGDDEVEARGYLTLNPLKYSHPVLSILLPVVFIALGGIGLPGGAVYLHPHRFRTRAQRAMVSLSGPVVNLVFAAIILIVVKHNYASGAHGAFWAAMAFLGFLQISAGLLNLVPLPGLDGYGAIEPYLDAGFQRSAEQFKPFGMLALFAFLQIQSVNTAFFNAVYWFFDLSGVPRLLSEFGYELIKFWKNVP
ncbi:MAG TPA: site-2 protease family protein [Jatrophihabitans sp.]|jgi:Zn-dependent protease